MERGVLEAAVGHVDHGEGDGQHRHVHGHQQQVLQPVEDLPDPELVDGCVFAQPELGLPEHLGEGLRGEQLAEVQVERRVRREVRPQVVLEVGREQQLPVRVEAVQDDLQLVQVFEGSALGPGYLGILVTSTGSSLRVLYPTCLTMPPCPADSTFTGWFR